MWGTVIPKAAIKMNSERKNPRDKNQLNRSVVVKKKITIDIEGKIQ